MPLALCTMSHSPLMGINQPAHDVLAAVDKAMGDARAFVRNYAPDLVVVFAPDHYNGFFYNLMPPFCVGATATSVGDYGSLAGPLEVDREAAYLIAEEALANDVDVAYSERMQVDHGFTQPLELLFGGITATPIVPIFINSISSPLGPPRRARRLGTAVGAAASRLGRRVLLIGSGGLSHDPPIPTLQDASAEVAERLVAGRPQAPGRRARRQKGVIQLGRDFAAGTASLHPLNPEWDTHVMSVLSSGRLDEIDTWTTAWCLAEGGSSAHEIRTWIAAYSALSTTGTYDVTTSFYHPIPEWIAGFGITTAHCATP